MSPLQEGVASVEPGTKHLCVQPEMRDRVRLDPLWVVRSRPRQVAPRPSKPTARDSRSSVRSCYKLLMLALSPLEGWLSGVSSVTCYEMQGPLSLCPQVLSACLGGTFFPVPLDPSRISFLAGFQVPPLCSLTSSGGHLQRTQGLYLNSADIGQLLSVGGPSWALVGYRAAPLAPN